MADLLLSSSASISIFLSGVLAVGILACIRRRGRVSLFHSRRNNLFLRKKQGSGKIAIVDVCRSVIPEHCRLNPFLFNGHLQTAWAAAKLGDVPIYYKRRIFKSDHAVYRGQFAVDFMVDAYDITKDDETTDSERKYTLLSGLPERTSFFRADELSTLPSNDTKPMLVVLHGLSGGSHELYLRHVLGELSTSGGWEACVVNSRGCAQTRISSSVLYNARATWDVRQTVEWLRKIFPNRPLFGIGFSLGANILANYLGEEGDACILKAAVLCANPWNLDVTSVALQRTFLGLNVYSRVMGKSMKKLFDEHVEEVSKNPRVDVEEVKRITYLHEFDRAVQCPLWGYPTEGAYYRDASSIDSLLAIRIPFFAVQSEDDPIVAYDAIPFQEFCQTPYGVMLTTSWGGHLGWFEPGGKRWFVKPVANFLNIMAKEIDLDAPFVVEKPDEVPSSAVSHSGPSKGFDTTSKPVFNPMCRKLNMGMSQ